MNLLLMWKLSLVSSALAATIFALAITAKSLKDFSRTGPQLRDEILQYYRLDLILSLTRLIAWTWLILFLLAAIGTTTYFALQVIQDKPPEFWHSLFAGMVSIAILVIYRFCFNLLHLPANLEASSNYRMSRFFQLWQTLSVSRLKVMAALITLVPLASWIIAVLVSAARHDWFNAMLFAALPVFAGLVFLGLRVREPRPVKAKKIKVTEKSDKFNILMIGCDTLRADRVASGYHRNLTPFIDQLAHQGVHFTNCFVPCARTAPSLASLLTGTWPHHHGIRDNFVVTSEVTMNNVPSMISEFRRHDYWTVAISDWCGADFGKLGFGFEKCSLPKDQWNIKYLLKQGPKDIRLFLSLFVRNRFGRRFLSELYYLAGVPTTASLGNDTRSAISNAASKNIPFFINTFMSTTHGPFGSEYPYYTQFPGMAYKGDSKFVMSGLNEPMEVVRQQGLSKDKFDFAQIVDLYDGCVRNFDEEVKKIVRHLEQCGLADKTIIVIYSDHGMEFFERETWGQGNSVIIDDSARIPFIIVAPDGNKGIKISEVTRTIDIAPTLLDLSGCHQIPAGFDGTSLASVIRGQAKMPELFAYYETGIWFTKIPGLGEDHLHYPDLPDLLEVPDKRAATIGLKPSMRDLIINAKDRALHEGKWKLVRLALRDGPQWLLYDTASDPDCTRDVAHEFPEIVKTLRERGRDLWQG
jgi:arylsulfatase A-like enzyme